MFFLTLFRYEEGKAKGIHNYDRDLEDVIDRLIIECDRKIARALKRLEEEDAKAAIAISVSEVTQACVKAYGEDMIFFMVIHIYFLFICLIDCSHRYPRYLSCQKKLKRS